MTTKTHQVESMQVLASSIRPTSIVTRDINEQGYLLADGTHRGISHGIAPDGTHVLYVTTAGDDCLIADDLEQTRQVCQDLGDNNRHTEIERQRQGAQRILEAVSEVSGWYAGNELAIADLEWFAAKAREVLAVINEDETDADQ